MIRVYAVREANQGLSPGEHDVAIGPGVRTGRERNRNTDPQKRVTDLSIFFGLPRRDAELRRRGRRPDMTVAVEDAAQPGDDVVRVQLQDAIVEGAQGIAKQPIVDVGGPAVLKLDRVGPLRQDRVVVLLVEVPARGVAKLAREDLV